MDLSSELAEVTGTLIGDGCLSKYFVKAENRWRYEIAFTGNGDEFEYYLNFVQPMFQKYFGIKGRLFHRKDCSTRFHILSIQAFDFFSNLGIPIGEKSKTVFIPISILENKSLLISCLRGILDTDGSVYKRYSKKYKNHSRHYASLLTIQFKTVSRQLIEDVHNSLILLSIFPSRITHKENAYVIYITNQKEISKFIEIIGFRNTHHLNRLAKFSA